MEKLSGSNVEKRLISDIIVHKDWKYNEIKYDADLAILFLIEMVEFSEYIQAVCLTADTSIEDERAGTVVSSLTFFFEKRLSLNNFRLAGEKAKVLNPTRRFPVSFTLTQSAPTIASIKTICWDQFIRNGCTAQEVKGRVHAQETLVEDFSSNFVVFGV